MADASSGRLQFLERRSRRRRSRGGERRPSRRCFAYRVRRRAPRLRPCCPAAFSVPRARYGRSAPRSSSPLQAGSRGGRFRRHSPRCRSAVLWFRRPRSSFGARPPIRRKTMFSTGYWHGRRWSSSPAPPLVSRRGRAPSVCSFGLDTNLQPLRCRYLQLHEPAGTAGKNRDQRRSRGQGLDPVGLGAPAERVVRRPAGIPAAASGPSA